VAAVVWAALLVAGVVAALRLLEVHDWRCYSVALASTAVLMGVVLGNLSIALLPFAAAAWRWRNRWLAVGAAVAVLVAAKVFLWPLALWLVFTRRYRAAIASAIGAVALLGVSWAAIGFSGMRTYPELIHSLDRLYASHSYSLVTLGRSLGLGGVSPAMPFVVAGAVLAYAIWVARRQQVDAELFSLMLVVALAATPIVWPHTVALLFVAIAVVRPRLGPLWFAPLLLWPAEAIPGPSSGGTACCRPDGVSSFAWGTVSAPSALVPALGTLLVLICVTAAIAARGVVRDERA
jgi:hypothetical protein